MTASEIKCPICGNNIQECSVDSINLNFLEERAKDGKINAAISLARIVWTNIPELRLTADSKAIVEGLFVAVRQELQKQVNDVLRPFEVFTRNFPTLIEKLPEDVKKDLQREFKETKTKLEEEFRLLRGFAPTFNNVVDALRTVSEGIETITKKEIEELKQDLTSKFRETLEKMGFPEPEQMKLLSQLLPAVLPLLQELMALQKVPSEKGKFGELELLKELRDYFPEDDYKHIGGPGDTDIIATPIYGGFPLSQRVLIESKKNNSGWNRDFINEVRRHMQANSNRFAILAVEVMPKGAKGFLIEHFKEGAILVTSRNDVCIAYGALRSVFIATYPFEVNAGDLRKLFEEKRIEEAIKDVLHYQEYLKKIRTKSASIMLNAKSIVEISDDLNTHLRICLTELQKRIRNAVEQIMEARPSANTKNIQPTY